jgi:hypothetical protein
MTQLMLTIYTSHKNPMTANWRVGRFVRYSKVVWYCGGGKVLLVVELCVPAAELNLAKD